MGGMTRDSRARWSYIIKNVSNFTLLLLENEANHLISWSCTMQTCRSLQSSLIVFDIKRWNWKTSLGSIKLLPAYPSKKSLKFGSKHFCRPWRRVDYAVSQWKPMFDSNFSSFPSLTAKMEPLASGKAMPGTFSFLRSVGWTLPNVKHGPESNLSIHHCISFKTRVGETIKKRQNKCGL